MSPEPSKLERTLDRFLAQAYRVAKVARVDSLLRTGRFYLGKTPRGWSLFLDRLGRRLLPSFLYRTCSALTWRRVRDVPSMDLRVLSLSRSDTRFLNRHYPEILDRKLKEAETVCRWRFNFLGTDPDSWEQARGEWHLDLESGYRWPLVFYADSNRSLIPGDGVDVKVPWELSRCHQLVVLAQAWWLSGQDRFARECLNHWTSWVEKNPWCYGVNWSNAMEVAIRAVNWILAFALLEGYEGLDEDTSQRLHRSLYEHRLYLERNLEFSFEGSKLVAGNHFLANLSGLVILSALSEDDESSRAKEVWMDLLEEQVDIQILRDGFFFESSTSYHRLALELLFFTELLTRDKDNLPSARYRQGMNRMASLIRGILCPDGTVPQIGDNDDGRLLILSSFFCWKRHDHRYLLDLLAVSENGPEMLPPQGEKVVALDRIEHVFWCFGKAGIQRWNKINQSVPAILSQDFPDAGIHVIREGIDNYALLRTKTSESNLSSPVERVLPRAHAHNDALSVEVWVGGRQVLRDSGTFCYTRDLDERNRFRATSAHNTVCIDKLEQSRLSHDPFSLGVGPSIRSKFGSHGPRQLGAELNLDEIQWSRRLGYDRVCGCWEIIDDLQAEGCHQADWYWHLNASFREAIVEQRDTIAVLGPGFRLETTCKHSVVLNWQTFESSFSPRYGTMLTTFGLRIGLSFAGKITVYTTVGLR